MYQPGDLCLCYLLVLTLIFKLPFRSTKLLEKPIVCLRATGSLSHIRRVRLQPPPAEGELGWTPRTNTKPQPGGEGAAAVVFFPPHFQSAARNWQRGIVVKLLSTT